MDISCPTCGEPWDAYHMRHCEPHEWGGAPAQLEIFFRNGRFSGKDDQLRVAARGRGWLFVTDSVYSFVACPSCVNNIPLRDAKTLREKRFLLAHSLEFDDDALAAALAAA